MIEYVIVSTCDACIAAGKKKPSPGRTVTFALDGADYETELCDTHEITLMTELEPYTDNGRKLKTAKRPGPVIQPQKRTTASRMGSKQIRAWARDQGLTVSNNGRIPVAIQEKYDAAMAV